jgi:hypothetical protein
MLKRIQQDRGAWLPVVFCLAILPACLLGFLIVKYSVNVPFQDQWAIARLLPKWVEGTLSFSDLIAQHNESRKFFPRLIFLALAQFTHWDVRYEMLVSFLLVCLVAINLYRLNRLTVGGSALKGLLLAAIANLIIFSPVQWDNWLWGIQVVVFVPIACITTAISVCYSQLKLNIKFGICLVLAIVSTYSYANGMLYWLVVFPVLLPTWRDWLAHKRLVIGWWIGFAIACTVYFYNYQQPAQTPSFAYAFTHPIAAVNYFLAFLGNPLGYGGIFPLVLQSSLVGLLLLLVAAGICLYFAKYRTELIYPNRGWLSLGSYSLLSASITTLGRVGFGIEQATSSRYTTFSLYFLVALMHLVAIALGHALGDRPQSLPIDGTDKFRTGTGALSQPLPIDGTDRFRAGTGALSQPLPIDGTDRFRAGTGALPLRAIAFGIGTLLILFLFMHSQTFIHSVQMMGYTRTSRLQGKACLLAINNFVQEDCLKEKVSPRLSVVQERVHPINKYGFLQPPLLTTKIAEEISGDKLENANKYGYFDSLQQNADGSYTAIGWAILPQKQESADAVILTYTDTNNKSIMFAIADNQFPRDDIAKAYGNHAYRNSGWLGKIAKDKLPMGKTQIRAWAFDTDTGRAFRLSGNHD